MTIRIYFNRKEDAPYVWSVDWGDISTERHFMTVTVEGSVTLTSCYDPTKDNVGEPRAWFEIKKDGWLFEDQPGHAVIKQITLR